MDLSLWAWYYRELEPLKGWVPMGNKMCKLPRKKTGFRDLNGLGTFISGAMRVLNAGS